MSPYRGPFLGIHVGSERTHHAKQGKRERRMVDPSRCGWQTGGLTSETVIEFIASVPKLAIFS